MRSAVVRNACYGLVVAAVALLGFATSATTAFAGPAANFRAFGQGNVPAITPDCSQSTGNKLCPGTDSCFCTPIAGKGTCGTLGGAITYSGVVATDTSLSVGPCNPANGTVTLVSSTNPANKLLLNFNGTVCLSPEPTGTTTSAFILNAVYFIDAANSKGTFHGATGSGNVGGSRDLSSTALLGSIIGTIRVP